MAVASVPTAEPRITDGIGCSDAGEDAQPGGHIKELITRVIRRGPWGRAQDTPELKIRPSYGLVGSRLLLATLSTHSANEFGWT
jgi:hypothetical protein